MARFSVGDKIRRSDHPVAEFEVDAVGSRGYLLFANGLIRSEWINNESRYELVPFKPEVGQKVWWDNGGFVYDVLAIHEQKAWISCGALDRIVYVSALSPLKP